jgi:hypothetical protein
MMSGDNIRSNKYSLVLNRRLESLGKLDIKKADAALLTLRKLGVLSEESSLSGSSFFVMRFEDTFVAPALRAYAREVQKYAMADSYQPEAKALLEYSNFVLLKAYEAARSGRIKLPD